MKKIFRNLTIIFFVYTVGPIISSLFMAFKLKPKIKIVNPENFPKLSPGMIIACNHPDLLDSMFEIFLMPALFFPQVALNPLKLAPYFTPDKGNFTDKWFWFWLKLFAMPVQRNGGKGSLSLAREKIVAIESKRPYIQFFEGGRTCTNPTGNFQYSRNHKKKIRTVRDSFGKMVKRTQSSVINVWLENGDVPDCPGKPLFSIPRLNRGPITVKFGRKMDFETEFQNKTPVEITALVTENMLELAEQE